jgi:hypothetical protein
VKSRLRPLLIVAVLFSSLGDYRDKKNRDHGKRSLRRMALIMRDNTVSVR